MLPLNRSLDVDFRLWRQDLRGSHAWAQALVRAGVITAEEGTTLHAGLEKVAERLEDFEVSEAPDEDVHSLVERLLHEEVGPVAGKLHTGRSRNDQVATDFRLWGMEACNAIQEHLINLLRALSDLAERTVEIILPGHTHLQQAQPIRAAHWALSHFWPIHRDVNRFAEACTSANSLPLGSGALAGCPFLIDREWLREALGFARISENSLDAVSDRDWAVEIAFAASLLGVHLSRLAEDLVVFSSREFGFVKLPEGFCTGSSLMPQKQNPDSAELVRGKAGRLLGNLSGILALLKGLPTGYNRDLQEDKAFLFDTVDTVLLILPVLEGVVGGMDFQPDAIGARTGSDLLATDIADYLVRRGVPFRESHEVLGRLVRLAEEEGKAVTDLPLSDFVAAHSAFREDVAEVFSAEASVEARVTPGGTARDAVHAQLALARQVLGD